MAAHQRTIAATDIRAGDLLADDHVGSGVVVGAVLEPGRIDYVWAALEDGRDVKIRALQHVTVYRTRTANAHVQAVLSDYIDARHQWELAREATALGYATEMREYAELNPPPRYADFLRNASKRAQEEHYETIERRELVSAGVPEPEPVAEPEPKRQVCEPAKRQSQPRPRVVSLARCEHRGRYHAALSARRKRQVYAPVRGRFTSRSTSVARRRVAPGVLARIGPAPP